MRFHREYIKRQEWPKCDSESIPLYSGKRRYPRHATERKRIKKCVGYNINCKGEDNFMIEGMIYWFK